MTDLQNPTPGSGAPATPATEPAAATGTVQPGGDAGQGQSAPTPDGFTKVDPNSLPPQLRSAYDNMLRDYKEKTTKLSETVKSEVVKATEAYRQKAELYDKLSGQEDFVRQWNEYVQKVNGAQTQGQVDSATSELKQKLQEIEAKVQESELREVVEAFSEAVDDKGQKMHPDFDKFNGLAIGQVPGPAGQAQEYSFLRACIELAQGSTPQEKLANGYKTAKETYDRIFEEGKKAGMGRLQAKVQNGSQPPSATSPVSGVAPRKAKNALEAIQFARQGLAVPAD